MLCESSWFAVSSCGAVSSLRAGAVLLSVFPLPSTVCGVRNQMAWPALAMHWDSWLFSGVSDWCLGILQTHRHMHRPVGISGPSSLWCSEAWREVPGTSSEEPDLGAARPFLWDKRRLWSGAVKGGSTYFAVGSNVAGDVSLFKGS